ncbi:hypothetical protein JCM10369A_16340 [Nocardioides pyridinolyticus]
MERITEKLLSWASLLEDGTREQAVTTARMPFIHPHLALMPDAHQGLGATVGSVIPTRGAIMPAAVGVDIGCGMIAVRTQFAREDLPADRRRLRQEIERAVPLSAGAANRTISRDHTRERLEQLRGLAEEAGFDPAASAKRWDLQLGTLGSGNHFIEVTADERSRVWLFLHSGSRVSATRSPSGTSAWLGGSATARTCRTATWPTSPRAPRSSTPTSRRCGGRRPTRCSTARR